MVSECPNAGRKLGGSLFIRRIVTLKACAASKSSITTAVDRTITTMPSKTHNDLDTRRQKSGASYTFIPELHSQFFGASSTPALPSYSGSPSYLSSAVIPPTPSGKPDANFKEDLIRVAPDVSRKLVRLAED